MRGLDKNKFNVVQRRFRPKKPINQRLSRGKAGMLERVRTVAARELRSVLSLEQNAIRYTIPYVKLELALPLSLLSTDSLLKSVP